MEHSIERLGGSRKQKSTRGFTQKSNSFLEDEVKFAAILEQVQLQYALLEKAL